MSDNSQVSGFPKNLAFNLRRMDGALIKQRIRVNSDKNSYIANERCSFNFPLGRMIDTRSVTLYAKATTVGAGNHLPRYGLNSLIENLSIVCNSRTLQNTPYYNYIFNCLADVYGYGSQEQASKRLYENFDPSIRSTNVQGEGAPVITNNAGDKTNVDSLYLSVNNWLGFLNSSSPTINLNDMGQLTMTVTWAGNGVLWVGTDASASTAGTYKLEEVYLSMETVTYTNSLYHELVKNQLEGEGLKIGYHEYLVSVGNLTAKSTAGITHTAQFSSGSIDGLFATFRPTSYDTISPLRLSTGGASIVTFPQVLADPVTNVGTLGSFNNSLAFQRNGSGIDNSSWYVDGTPFTQNSTPVEIFNNTLQANYANLDLSVGGLYAGVLTTGLFHRYFYLDYISTENVSGDSSQNYVSGLKTNGGVCQVTYNARFKSGTTDSVYPIICAVTTRVLTVKMGRSLDLME